MNQNSLCPISPWLGRRKAGAIPVTLTAHLSHWGKTFVCTISIYSAKAINQQGLDLNTTDWFWYLTLNVFLDIMAFQSCASFASDPFGNLMLFWTQHLIRFLWLLRQMSVCLFIIFFPPFFIELMEPFILFNLYCSEHLVLWEQFHNGEYYGLLCCRCKN